MHEFLSPSAPFNFHLSHSPSFSLLAVAGTKADEPVNKRLPSSVIKWEKIAAIKRNKTCEDQMLINLFYFRVFFLFSHFPMYIYIYFALLLFSLIMKGKHERRSR